MAKRIVWTPKATKLFTKILEFYCQRNHSKTYSRKLNKEINETVKLLAKYPLIGLKTDMENIRVLIKGDFKIFYEIRLAEIVIHLVWDSRQDPSKLNL
jgi:plasmid stabilization system protein ParE